jgi:hypothetical protein
VWNAELVRCPQLPTTLPTLDELIGTEGIDEGSVAENLLRATASPPDSAAFAGHVFTLHAELEGLRLAPVFEKLVAGWRSQGYELVPMRALYERLQALSLPRCEVGPGRVPGRSGTLFTQRGEFLGDVDLAQAA